MVSFVGRVIIGVLLCTCAVAAQSRLKEGTGSIAGRVTVGGKPAPGVIVTLMESSSNESRALSMLMRGAVFEKATTDIEGRYRFTALAEGVYEVAAFAPTLVAQNDRSNSVTLADGGNVEDIDFSLSKGGAITGKVTTKDGRPVIMEPVSVSRVDQPNVERPVLSAPSASFTTDDRGIYRIYGLAPGRYRVSVGRSNSLLDAIGMSMKRPAHPQTFHPAGTDEARAAIIELTAGGEASNIDIKLGDANTTYKATGRVVDADTNKPIPNAVVSYSAIKSETAEPRMPGVATPSSSTGEFRLEGLVPGQYGAFVFFGLEASGSDFYSDRVTFEVKSEDISGLQIKAHRGASIGGVAVVEGTTDPAILESLGQIELFATVTTESDAPNFARSRISGNGSFLLRGLRPGRARIMIQDVSGLRVRRVERNGVAQSQGVEVGPGDHLTDVRVVFAFAGGVVRGRVNVEGGSLPKEARLSVVARRKTDSSDPNEANDDFEWADVDSAGRFLIEGLTPGEYEVVVTAVLNPGAPAAARQIRQAAGQLVVVTGESPAETVLVLDLGKTNERD